MFANRTDRSLIGIREPRRFFRDTPDEATGRLIGDLAKETLALLGSLVIHVWDAREAVEEAAKQDFELILLDIHMPEYSGIEACRLIRANGRNSCTLIGALTASVTSEEVAKCLDSGIDFVVGKPLTFAKIRDLLAERFPG